MIGRRLAQELRPDPSRVVAQLFLPGEELHVTHSRAAQIVTRVMALDEAEVEQLAAELVRDFGDRHRDYAALLEQHAGIVASRVDPSAVISLARRRVLGAGFTAEYAVEAAALCNPCAFLHPDQRGLDAGQVRVAISLRGIGEGHISSIEFGSAVLGPGAAWRFEARPLPVSRAVTSAAEWTIAQFKAVLGEQGRLEEFAVAVLAQLPPRFGGLDLEQALAAVPHDLTTRPGASATADQLRTVLASAYTAAFDDTIELSQRVLMPAAAEESNGMEDARFTRFVEDDGSVRFVATYTAYDGRLIAPRLLTSDDLLTFHAHRLAGPAARNKGMALFPRPVHGRYLALCRSDGESTSLARSQDGYRWGEATTLHDPTQSWEMVQVGNCGPPLETPAGWLVITHGVGPMRVYSIGALLLDLDDPSQVIGRTRLPLLSPSAEERDGYVPNVLYSCGAFLHDGLVWLPLGIDDSRIGVAYVALADLLGALTSDL